ncbi:MAG: PQQ-dependent sugar dehydrogenase [Myxococcota bacterium]
MIRASLLLIGFSLLACQSKKGSPPDQSVAGADSNGAFFCDLPGSIRFTTSGRSVAGGVSAGKLDFLRLPNGFCAHYFGNVGNPRQMRFAPGGELFVASPTKGTTGGGANGKQAVVVMPDDDRDGEADSTLVFAGGIPATQGMMFTETHFYYQDLTKILRVPYSSGDRAPSAAPEVVAEFKGYQSDLHWQKTLDRADDGTIYVGNGSDQGESCDPGRPFRGGILTLEGNQVSKGFRNPIAVRCQRGHNLCFAAELAMDYSGNQGGREKLVPIRQGDDWGFPCCHARNVPAPDVTPTPDCSKTTPEDVAFVIGDTPFSFDFEPGKWPDAYREAIFVPLHGVAGTWLGAKVVAVAVDRSTGLPKKASNLDGSPMGGMSDFATGWDDGTRSHGRPAAVTFAPDGRMFVSNDTNGDIFWVAPMELKR